MAMNEKQRAEKLKELRGKDVIWTGVRRDKDTGKARYVIELSAKAADQVAELLQQ